MSSCEEQKGLTAISIALLLALAGFAIFLLFNLIQLYVESYSVGDSVSSLAKELDIRDKPKEEVYKLLQKRLDINDIRSVTKDDITIQKSGKTLQVQVDYEVRIPLMGNIDLALNFHHAT